MSNWVFEKDYQKDCFQNIKCMYLDVLLGFEFMLVNFTYQSLFLYNEYL